MALGGYMFSRFCPRSCTATSLASIWYGHGMANRMLHVLIGVSRASVLPLALLLGLTLSRAYDVELHGARSKYPV